MKTITYKEYLRREKNIKELGEQGVVFLFKKNKFKLILGGICSQTGLVLFSTLWVSIFLG